MTEKTSHTVFFILILYASSVAVLAWDYTYMSYIYNTVYVYGRYDDIERSMQRRLSSGLMK